MLTLESIDCFLSSSHRHKPADDTTAANARKIEARRLRVARSKAAAADVRALLPLDRSGAAAAAAAQLTLRAVKNQQRLQRKATAKAAAVLMPRRE